MDSRANLFDKVGDYEAFERALDYASERVPTRILAYCLMPNHWHFVLWPQTDGELTDFLRRLTHTHAQRWHAHRHTAGTGHLYQGRCKSFPAQADDHLLTVIRYVERAKLVEKVERWHSGVMTTHCHAAANSSLIALACRLCGPLGPPRVVGRTRRSIIICHRLPNNSSEQVDHIAVISRPMAPA